MGQRRRYADAVPITRDEVSIRGILSLRFLRSGNRDGRNGRSDLREDVLHGNAGVCDGDDADEGD